MLTASPVAHDGRSQRALCRGVVLEQHLELVRLHMVGRRGVEPVPLIIVVVLADLELLAVDGEGRAQPPRLEEHVVVLRHHGRLALGFRV